MRTALFFLLMIPFLAQAETVINYDDGSTLTLEEGEKIHVTKGKLYQQRTYSNGKTIQFKVFPETTRRDYVPQPQDEYQVGSVAWCEAYVPWSEGLTFDMISWQRACDTNNDGEYVFCEDYTPTSQGLGFGYSQPNANDDRYNEECTD
jgi:hypothetical protein